MSHRMRYATVCSGIGAPEVAWSQFGLESTWCAEVDPFCCELLRQRFPGVPNLGDITANDFVERARTYGPVDVICGGTPCQSFSVAGLRGGLADDRGNLALRFLRVADALRPRWILWENVPGVLSSNSGRDFGAILGAMVELGYGVAYRVLDAQFFGVAQRRRRVFVVGCLGDWRLSAAVLFERDCLSGNPKPSREEGSVVAHCLAAGAGGGKFGTGRDGQDDFIVEKSLEAFQCHGSNVGPIGTLRASNSVQDGVPFLPIGFTCKDHGQDVGEDVSTTLLFGGGRAAVAFAKNQLGEVYCSSVMGTLNTNSNASGRNTPMVLQETASTLTSCWHKSAGQTAGENPGVINPVISRMGVRRLTPRECERLQGFPDDWTNIVYRGKPAADAPRYRSIGNSMAVPVLSWIGRRMERISGSF